jgi:hypothetical protein
MSRPPLTRQSTVVAAGNQVSSPVGEEAVILNVGEGVYYGVNAVGTRVWELIQRPASVDDIVQTIGREYDVAADRCERDVLGFLARLVESGLAETK